MIRRVTETAAGEGLELRLAHARSGNTFDGHRVLHFAAEHGLQQAVKERLLRAALSEEQAIGDRDVLVRVASEAGLDADAVRAVLSSDRFVREVRDDEERARELGITGVPFFVLDGRLGVSGAQPTAVLLRALTQAWEAAPATSSDAGAGGACGPNGCAPALH
jgi:predicted DsbA family dithiol-disulfide isomerase